MSIDNHSGWTERINSIIDSSGNLKEDSLSKLAQYIREAVSNDQRHKLAILLTSIHSKNILDMIVSNHDIVHELEIWWDESVDNTDLMCLLLKVLNHLPFTVETLLQHKLAKKLSKLTKAVNDNQIQDLSRSLEIKWRRLVEEYNVPFMKSKHSQTDKLIQSHMNDIFDQAKSPEHILSSKRKISESLSPKLSRKKVSFASKDSLVQIKYFECDPTERSGNVRSLEKGEFVSGYRSFTSISSPSISWYFPKPFTCEFDIFKGEESTEKKIQENREKYILATVYLDPVLAPQYPSECVSENTLEKSEKIYIIPLEQNSQVLYHESKQSSFYDKSIDNNLISLLSDPDLQKALDAVMGHSSNSHIK